MAKATGNECLGEVKCPDCNGVAYVYRTKRRGKHFYSRCPDCGLDQKTGSAPQLRLAQFVPIGTLAARPVDVASKPSEPSVLEVSEPEPELEVDSQQSEPEPEPEPKKRGFGVLWLGLPLAVLALVKAA